MHWLHYHHLFFVIGIFFPEDKHYANHYKNIPEKYKNMASCITGTGSWSWDPIKVGPNKSGTLLNVK